MSINPDNRFITGINKCWFEGQYDHDFGHNQFSGIRLYRSNIPDTTNTDPAPDMPEISKKPEILNSFFSMLTTEHKLQVIRVWAFERFEGLRFDKSYNVIGIDSEFLHNMDYLFSKALQYNVKIYLCLFDSWALYGNISKDLEERGLREEFLTLQNTWKRIIRSIIKDQQTRQGFLNNALRPLLEHIASKKELFAIDLLNEPEGLSGNDSQISMTNITNYVSACSEFIRQNYDSVKISCGFQKRETVKEHIEKLGPHLDFLDFHVYNETGYLESYHPSDFSHKPCIIGEAGYPQHLGVNNSEKNSEVVSNFLKFAHEKGYAGILPWIEDYSNTSEILQKTKDFALLEPMYKNNTKTDVKGNEKGCFIATAAMGSDFDPHIQYLREYRDFVLLKSRFNGIFKHIFSTYYKYSPPIAKKIKKHYFLRSIVKHAIIQPLVLSIKVFDKR